MWHPSTPTSNSDKLRSSDRIIREILRLYPVPPRPVDDPWLPTRNWLYQVTFIGLLIITSIFVFLIPWFTDQIRSGNIWRSRYVLSILSPVLIALLFYLVIHPIRDWWTGIRYGQKTTAVVQKITERPASTSVRGIWKVYCDNQWVEMKFRQYTLEQNTWIQDLREGDYINVLVHPTRQIVLLAYGP